MNKVLKALRIIHEYNISELASALQISQSHLSRIENGEKNPSDELLERYSKLFRVKVKTLKFFEQKRDDENMEYKKLLFLILEKMCGQKVD